MRVIRSKLVQKFMQEAVIQLKLTRMRVLPREAEPILPHLTPPAPSGHPPLPSPIDLEREGEGRVGKGEGKKIERSAEALRGRHSPDFFPSENQIPPIMLSR